MSKHLPSLNAMRAFVAVGKHGNLKDAATELFVSTSALSHQIKNMEETLGVSLFQRSKSGLSLSQAGNLIYKDLNHAFTQIQQTMRKLDAHQDGEILNISMLSTFAMRWFIPRLSDFQKNHPNIEVRISTSINLVDFSREHMDCAIRSGSGIWKGLHAEHLFSETFTPVCSPSIASKLQTPQDLQAFTLLHARLRPDDWQVWLSAVDTDFQPEYEQIFETRNFAIQAAVDGLGIAIVDPSLAAEEIKAKRLVTPFPQTFADESAYYLVYPNKSATLPSIQAFQNWLLSQVQQYKQSSYPTPLQN